MHTAQFIYTSGYMELEKQLIEQPSKKEHLI